jgi:four helix bundle protein
MEDKKLEDNLIVKLTFDFAVNVIKFVEQLEKEKRFVIAKQLLRCGTSIGANTREAQNSESKADFIHKFKIAAKEGDETLYWLLLCKHSKHYPNPDSLLKQIDSIRKVLNKIISTSKNKSMTGRPISKSAYQHISKSANHYELV